MKIELACVACGSNHFELGGAETDDSKISCGECGHVVGTLGYLKQRVAEEVVRRSGGLKKSRTPRAKSAG